MRNQMRLPIVDPAPVSARRATVRPTATTPAPQLRASTPSRWCESRGPLRPRSRGGERSRLSERQGRDPGIVSEAMQLLPLPSVRGPKRRAAHLEQILIPGCRTPPPGEDIGHPDGVPPRPSLVPRPQDAHRDVTAPLAQLAVLHDTVRMPRAQSHSGTPSSASIAQITAFLSDSRARL